MDLANKLQSLEILSTLIVYRNLLGLENRVKWARE